MDQQNTKSSLKDLAKVIFDKLGEVKHINVKDFTTMIMAQQSIAISEPSFRRRIYDVLSVFSCLGIIEKSDGNLTWLGKSTPKPPQYYEIKNRISTKEEVLRQKAWMLLMYKAFVKENMAKANEAEKKASFPFIYLEFPKNTAKIDQKDSSVVVINSDEYPAMMSPIEVLERYEFSTSSFKQVFNECPELAQCQEFLDIDYNRSEDDNF